MDWRALWRGKTSLAVRLGIEFCERGWSDHILTNFPSVVATSLMSLPDLRKCFIILDEGGTWLSRKNFDDVAAFLRKRDLVLVVPSVIPPPISARMLSVQRTFSLDGLGLPIWFYSSTLDYMNVKEEYKFTWYNPREIFGLYDTSAVTNDDGGLVTLINAFFDDDARKGRLHNDQNITEVLRKFGLRDSIPAVDVQEGDGVSGVEELRRVTEDAYEASRKFEKSISAYKQQRRRRRS